MIVQTGPLLRPALTSLEATMGELSLESNLDRIPRLCSLAAAHMARLRLEQLDEWRGLIGHIQSMNGFAVLQEDPFTRHSFVRPRGYPGDADLLDLLYRPDTIGSGSASEIGRVVFRAVSARSAPRAVLNRRALLAHKVDTLASASRRRLRVASLGCGHLREAEMMASVEAGLLEDFWAIDQDQRCVDEVRRAYAATPVRAIRGNVRDSVRHGFTDLHNLDFFYAAGLFDYLDDRLGRRLLSRMFDCLRPGGLLWIANFVPDIADRAYMEAVMDWWLVYRTPDALGTLDAEIDSHQIAHKRVFLEGEQNVAVLELRKL